MEGGTPQQEPRGETVPAAPPRRKERHPFRQLLRIAMPVILLLVLVRACVFQPCAIPPGSPSMHPTLLEGDVVLVNTTAYHLRSPESVFGLTLPRIELPGLSRLDRGDVVVFDHTEMRNGAPVTEQYIKRCVAIAGDTVAMVQGRITVNGREVPSVGGGRRSAADTARVLLLLRRGERIVLPHAGQVLPLDSLRAEMWRPLIEGEGSSVSYRNGIVHIAGLPATGYTVREEYFLALGDNDANSRDSRSFGPVPYSALVGRAWFIYWSRDPDDGVRWERIGMRAEG